MQIGDPSGRTTARAGQASDTRVKNVQSIKEQLEKLWLNVKCLGIKHQYSPLTSRKCAILNNRAWLERLSAVSLMRDLGSSMRLGPMLARDSYVQLYPYAGPSDFSQSQSAHGERRGHGPIRVQLPALPSLRLVDYVQETRCSVADWRVRPVRKHLRWYGRCAPPAEDPGSKHRARRRRNSRRHVRPHDTPPHDCLGREIRKKRRQCSVA